LIFKTGNIQTGWFMPVSDFLC